MKKTVVSTLRHSQIQRFLFIVATMLCLQGCIFPPIDLSPDGDTVAFSIGKSNGSSSTSDSSSADIEIVNIDTKKCLKLTENMEGAFSFGPSFSPDGKRIAFFHVAFNEQTSSSSVVAALYLIDIKGRNRTCLGTFRDEDLFSIVKRKPLWSRDGKKIVFMDREKGNYDICLVHVRSKKIQRLTKTPSQDLFPTWSPNSKQIAYISVEDFSKEEFDLKILPLRNLEKAKTITKGKIPQKDFNLEDEWIGFGPSWSPDGKKISYCEGITNSDIWIIDVSSGEKRRLTHGKDNRYSPSWSPKGDIISYIKNKGKDYYAYIIGKDGRDERPVSNLLVFGAWRSGWGQKTNRLAFVLCPESEFGEYPHSIFIADYISNQKPPKITKIRVVAEEELPTKSPNSIKKSPSKQ